ncbi:hypothetical protein ACHAWF_016105 [Thalassiosira exigua]
MNPSTEPPKWLQWYTNLNDTYTEDFVTRWTSAYENIMEPEGPPDWLYQYLIIQDENPFYNAQMEGGKLYCKDESITGVDGALNIRTCPKDWLPRDWLTDDPNPYDLADFKAKYSNFRYPASNAPDSPFKESCSFDTCHEDWLTNPTNPFSKVDDRGCHAFWLECRGLVPPSYQCHWFYEHCRATLTSITPYWEYPLQPCEESSTCLLSWLDQDTLPFSPRDNLACYQFAEYCQSEANERFPDYVYPTENTYCEGDPEHNCQEDWLTDETNPFDEGEEERCHNFWNFCRTRLLEEHPRYSYPLFRDVEVDDLLPGYCCRDDPVDGNPSSNFWGEPYTAARAGKGMECQDRGEWQFGLSPKACANGGGTFYPTPCVTLYRCIEGRPRDGDPGFNKAFEEWVIENEVHIYDPSDLDQCKQARRALGYDETYPGDKKVCETFRSMRCDDFFLDLAWVDEEARSSAIPKYEQIVYKEMVYPEDKPLYMKELTPFEAPENAMPKPVGKDTKDVLKALGQEKRTLQYLTGQAYDVLNKFADEFKLFEEQANKGCEAMENVYLAHTAVYETQAQSCKVVDVQTGGFTNPVYPPCQTTALGLLKTAKLSQAKWKACTQKMNVTKILQKISKLTLWAAVQGLKSRLLVLDERLRNLTTGAADDLETHRYTVAGYNLLQSFNKWMYESVGSVNVNMVEQHTQMRKELQKRHEDITNDVNQYTTCMANHLGVQMYKAFPKAETDPLSSTCVKVLGLDSDRRRLNENFQLRVHWKKGSLVAQQTEILELENKIVEDLGNVTEKEDAIMQELENVTAKEDAILAKEDRILEKENDILDVVEEIKEFLGINAAEEHGAKSEKAQPFKMKSENLFVDEEEIEMGDVHKVGTRHLMRLEGKLESMESKIKMMETKTMKTKMENKIEAMEGKMHGIEVVMAKIIEQNEYLMMQNKELTTFIKKVAESL